MSREYSRFLSSFWTGRTGRVLRRFGPEAQLLAAYLFTNDHANMLGLYALPVAYIAADTGLSTERVVALMAVLTSPEVRFCDYDSDAEVVWVREMARHQIRKPCTTPKDNISIGANRQYRDVLENGFLGEFFDKHGEYLMISERREPYKPTLQRVEPYPSKGRLEKQPDPFSKTARPFREQGAVEHGSLSIEQGDLEHREGARDPSVSVEPTPEPQYPLPGAEYAQATDRLRVRYNALAAARGMKAACFTPEQPRAVRSLLVDPGGHDEAELAAAVDALFAFDPGQSCHWWLDGKAGTFQTAIKDAERVATLIAYGRRCASPPRARPGKIQGPAPGEWAARKQAELDAEASAAAEEIHATMEETTP